MSKTPPEMSPPISAGLIASREDAGTAWWARIRSRNPGAKRSTCAVMSSVGSRSEPFGTWMYAQSTALPSGALVGSKSEGWTASTYGRSDTWPTATAFSLFHTSSLVPATCTVGALRTCSFAHGTGPSSAKSTFAAAAP